MNKLPILIYDSECTLCVRFKKALEFIDKDIYFATIYDDDLYEKYPQLNKEQCDEVMHLITEDNKILQAGEVITYLAKRTPGVKKFAWLIEKDSTQKTVDAFYDKVNQLRNTQRKKKNCRHC